MHEVTPNFFSVVCLGNFNPAILSIDFLRDHCNYEFEGDPQETLTPVVSTVEDDAIKMLVEFSKFQVSRNYDTKRKLIDALELAMAYLNVLKFTPISAMGVNFNYTISNVDQNKINLDYYEHIKAVGLEMSEKAELISTIWHNRSGEAKVRAAQLFIPYKDHLTFKAGVNNLGENIVLNMNFEVTDLERNRSRTNSLLSGFDDIFQKQENMLKRILPNNE